MKLSLLKLSSCSGCQVALLDALGDGVLELSDKIDFAPLLVDKQEIGECSIALVEGAVRTDEELKLLEEQRKKADVLVAFGTCAAFGGLPSLANMYFGQQVIGSVYGSPLKKVPKFFDEAKPIDEFVDVDYYLPGCPPPEKLIREFLLALINGEEPRKVTHPVCAECNRTVVFRKVERIKWGGVPEICLLSQGYLCLGSVTRGGCGAACPKAGIPCAGCRGPTPKVMILPCKDYLTEILDRLQRITGFHVKPEDVPSIYAFVFGSDMKDKPVSEIKTIMKDGRAMK